MARGNKVVVSADPRGKFREGYIATAEKPGTIVQRDYTVALKGGRYTYKVYTRGADGKHPQGAYWVLIEDYLQGQLPTTAYAAGSRCFLYCPESGDELNLLVANLAGTADDHALGEMLIVDDTTGKMIVTTGSPQDEVATLQEAIVDPTVDTLAWCVWN